MMELYLNVFGHRYEDSEPCFLTIESGQMVFNRITQKWVTWDSLQALATRKSHTWQPREVGIPSIMWQINNSLNTGQRWAPGLDDTEALASEIVVNGELWTGATGATPPTSWTGSAQSFTDFSGTLGVWADPVTGGDLSQALTGTPGEYYVLEVNVNSDTTSGCRISLDGQTLPIAPGLDDGSSRIVAVSFQMPASGTVDFSIVFAGGAYFATRFIRCYLESELTGAGVAAAGVTPTPDPEFVVLGPYASGETTYFIQKFRADLNKECKVWLDVDSDPDPDVALSLQQVCDSMIEDSAKIDINQTLVTHGCSGLPCMTQAGNLRMAYRKGE